MDRIKELLTEWAGWHIDGFGTGYPRQVAFATERVQNDNRSTETLRTMPEQVARLNDEIERLAPSFKRIINAEYCKRGPQKLKAAALDMPRQMYCARLSWVHEHLSYVMWGELRQAA